MLRNNMPFLRNAEHPNSCLDDVTGEPHAVSTVWSLSDTCGQAACIQRQDTLYITYESCGFAQVPIRQSTEEGLNRREGKGRRCFSGDRIPSIPCRVSYFASGQIEE